MLCYLPGNGEKRKATEFLRSPVKLTKLTESTKNTNYIMDFQSEIFDFKEPLDYEPLDKAHLTTASVKKCAFEVQVNITAKVTSINPAATKGSFSVPSFGYF